MNERQLLIDCFFFNFSVALVEMYANEKLKSEKENKQSRNNLIVFSSCANGTLDINVNFPTEKIR